MTLAQLEPRWHILLSKDGRGRNPANVCCVPCCLPNPIATFLKTMVKLCLVLQLYVSFGTTVNFTLWHHWACVLVRFRHKNYSVRVRKGSRFGFRLVVLYSQTQLEISKKKISFSFFMLTYAETYVSNSNHWLGSLHAWNAQHILTPYKWLNRLISSDSQNDIHQHPGNDMMLMLQRTSDQCFVIILVGLGKKNALLGSKMFVRFGLKWPHYLC